MRATEHHGGAAPLGRELRAAREARGLTLHDLEERTKIRWRYLEALEEERWSALPSPAHAKSFVRVVAGELELDAEAMADRARRLLEPLPGQVDAGRPRRWPALVAIALLGGAGVAAGIVAAGESGDEERVDVRKGAAHGPGERAAGSGDSEREGGRGRAPATGPVILALETKEPVELCLVATGNLALIDSQRFGEGALEGPFESDEFRLDLLSGGTVVARIDGREERLRSREPARYRITSRGAVPEPMRRESCP